MFVAGQPEPKHRHRTRVVTPKGGGKAYPQHYNDERTTAWEESVAEQVRAQIMNLPVSGNQDFVLPFDGRLIVAMRFNLARPAYLAKKVVHHTKKPDVDNLAKSVLDGLQKARLIENDNLVTDLLTYKRYVETGHPLGVELDITATT